MSEVRYFPYKDICFGKILEFHASRFRVQRFRRYLYALLPEMVEAAYRVDVVLRRWLQRPTEADFRALRRFPPRRGLALDLGANRGQSIEAIRMVWPGARIVAFEPIPQLARKLSRRYPDVTVINKAVADRTERATLHVPQYRRRVWDALASLSEKGALNWLGPNTIAFFDSKHVRVHRFEIEVTTVDSLGLDPDFVKLDLQGHEHRAILGMAATIERSRPILLVEAAKPETVRYLAERGYRSFAFEAGDLHPDRTGSPNTFFLPQ